MRFCHSHMESLFTDIDRPIPGLLNQSSVAGLESIFVTSIPGMENTVKSTAFILIAPN